VCASVWLVWFMCFVCVCGVSDSVFVSCVLCSVWRVCVFVVCVCVSCV